jgi:hypothetical protein
VFTSLQRNWIAEKYWPLSCTLAETKIGRRVYSSSPLVSTVVIRILRLFVALYLLFLPSHRYRTKHNRSCQLLLDVRMQYGYFTQCQKRIKSLISFKVSVLLAELYVKYKFSSHVVKRLMWYDTWLGNYNSTDGRFESTAVMISVVVLHLFVYLAFS